MDIGVFEVSESHCVIRIYDISKFNYDFPEELHCQIQKEQGFDIIPLLFCVPHGKLKFFISIVL